ncbi:hypothetical protein M8J76_000908 [Diaphorina citri]|nr:hypothetical protein M8J76_000908 [Diaphorina citri]
MVQTCVAFGCKNSAGKFDATGKKIQFHRFPWNNKLQLDKWVVAMKRENWYPTKHSMICSAHFKPSDYLDRPGTERKYLKEQVVPSLFSFAKSKPERRPLVRASLPSKSAASSPLPGHSLSTDPPCSRPSSSSADYSMYDEPSLSLTAPSTPQRKKKSNLPTTPSKPKYRRKIKILQQRLKRRDSKINSLKKLISTLRKQGGNDNLVQSIENNFDEEFFKILECQFKNKDKKTGKRYDDSTKTFALTLQFYSPKAYKYVRSIFKSLPHPATIRKWVSVFNCEPGFLEEVFQYLKSQTTNKDFSLVLDSMSIRKQVSWDKKNKKMSGYVDLGNGLSDQNETYASEALVFMVVSMKQKFKCPVGYFLVDKISAEVQAELLKSCIKKLNDVGVSVVNVTFDGAQANIKTAKILGCDFTARDPTFAVDGRNINVSLDACHMVKLARNTLADKKIITSPNGDIKWQYLVDLVEEQEKIGLKFANKLSGRHIKFFNKKMNVSLAVQTLSASTANAIEFLMSSGHPKFKDAEATIEFIRNIDKLFDALNSRNPFEKGLKRPLFPERREEWETFFSKSIDYLNSLTIDGQNILNHQRKMFALGFITSYRDYEFTKAVDLGGLKLPSFGVLEIVKKAENFFQQYLAHDVKMSNAIDKAAASVSSFYRSSGQLPFPGSHPLMNELVCEDLHETQVLKKIVSSRIFHHAKGMTEKDILKNQTSVRQKLNKLVLFQNV